MTADEIGDDLLSQVCTLTDAVEDGFEAMELLERWLAHELQHMRFGVLGSNFQSSAHVVRDEFLRIFSCRTVQRFVLVVVEQKVVSYTTSDETLLHARHFVHSPIDVEQGTMVAVQVGTDARMDARRSLALSTQVLVLASHLIHIRRRTTKVADVTAEVGHLGDGLYLPEYALLRTTCDELTLMC